jgi:hypothetical protein
MYSDGLCLSQVKRNGKIFTNPDEDANATSSAPDGDLDAAYALLLAGRKWQHKPYTERGVKVTGVGLLTAWHYTTDMPIGKRLSKPNESNHCCGSQRHVSPLTAMCAWTSQHL